LSLLLTFFTSISSSSCLSPCLPQVHQILTTNGLRERVALRCDGGMRTGRDVLVMAALGADEYGFGTVAMIATGCIMARVCHTNNCPVGVASQREELRARFPGE
jgi:glutamate synthase (ferredoxin)